MPIILCWFGFVFAVFGFALNLVELQAESIESAVTFLILTLGIAQVLAEDIPGAAESSERGIEFFQILPDLCSLLFYLQPMQAHHHRHQIGI